MNEKRCRELAAFMRGLKSEQYDQRTFCSYPAPDTFGDFVGCGTTACIGGWACALFAPRAKVLGSAGVQDIYAIACTLLDLDDYHASELFQSCPFDRDSGDPSPKQAAAVIDHMVDTGVVDWDVAARLMT